MPTNILDTIITHKRAELAGRKAARPLPGLLPALASAPPTSDFASALCDPTKPAPRVIAEIKRRSPSKGLLRPDLDPATIASIYEQNGAAAISVLCDNRFFGGSLDDLAQARAATSLPILCKEFILDEYQIIEARIAGASAVILLASVLSTRHLREYRFLCAELGMAALVEVHYEPELRSSLNSGAQIIGINNRDLRTFTVDMNTTASLLPLLPTGTTVVSESGIRSHADAEKLVSLGVHTVLVGEGLIAAPDIAAATREICGLPSTLSATLQEVSLS